MIFPKRCVKCGCLFDIDTSKDKCPECRKKENNVIDNFIGVKL